MGPLGLPSTGIIYVDTQILIYSIEQIAPYSDLLVPMWEASDSGELEIATSELTLMEALAGPMKTGDRRLVKAYDELLNSADLTLVPIDRKVLLSAAKLRVQTPLKTPDAIHAATALCIGCSAFITNDAAFRTVRSLPVQILNDCCP